MKIITMFLSCANREEALKITEELLDKKLAACVRLSDVNSYYWWNNKRENSSEVLMMIESVEDKFDDIEAAVKRLHSYETFVLEAIPVVRASKRVENWVREAVT
jgi:periplasmic divalent cation tolerance protein